jgi:hypothetical protein
MANISLVNNWVPTIYQWADGDVLDGGPDSLEVLPIKQLANNSLYQRLRNVTPWNSDLAAAYGYPAGACVMHLGVSWRAVLDNAVAPGSDATKWERWGYSESELDARMSGPGTGALTPNGWGRLPNGLIIQWGNITRSGAPTGIGQTVSWSATLPIAFPSATFCAIATSGYGGIPHVDVVNDPVEHNISVSGWTTTAIEGLALRIYGAPSESDWLNINWIAFGI